MIPTTFVYTMNANEEQKEMFTIAGPVFVYGLSASVVYGLVYWVCTCIF